MGFPMFDPEAISRALAMTPEALSRKMALGGGGRSAQPGAPSPASAYNQWFTPGQMQGPATLGETMAGGPFNDLFGTGKGAVKSVTTKPDGSKTVSYNTPSMEPFKSSDVLGMVQNQQPRGAQAAPAALPAPNALPIPEAPPINANLSFGNRIGALLSDPGFQGFLGQLGQGISSGQGIAQPLTNLARGQAFNKLLAGQMAGGGAPQPATPFGVGSTGLSSFSLGMLSPEEQMLAATTPTDLAYKQALISGVETPEERFKRQVILEMLGQRPAAPNQGSFRTLEVGPDGKPTPGVSHQWLYDDISGEPIRYVGRVGATHAPQAAAGGGADETRQWYQKAVDEAKLNVQREASQYGRVQTDAFGNVTGIEWTDPDAPRRYQESYYRHLTGAIKRFQTLGLMPAGFETPFQQAAPSPAAAAKPKLQLE